MDPIRRPLDPLGREIRRWLSEADGRLLELNAGASDLPRADDFGHVTAKLPDAPPPATPLRRGTSAAASVFAAIASERHGIFVASGWGSRVRTA